jgi:hypothetical protein
MPCWGMCTEHLSLKEDSRWQYRRTFEGPNQEPHPAVRLWVGGHFPQTKGYLEQEQSAFQSLPFHMDS